MKIRYKNKVYKVNVKDFLIIIIYQLMLIIKRIVRYILRALQTFKPLMLILLFSISKFFRFALQLLHLL